MDFYHGSIVGGLTVLTPFANPRSNLKEACVYLSLSKQVALHYIMDSQNRPPKSPMLDIRKDGVLVFQEMFSGALEYLYKGLSGYIYHCAGDYPIDESTGVSTCATSFTPVPVADCEFIDDVYERIMEYERYGLFIYEKYEDLPRYRHDIIRGHVMRAIKADNLLTDTASPLRKLYLEKYAQYMKEAQVLSEHGLL